MQPLSPQWDAILLLQDKLAHFLQIQNHFECQTYDHAIGLALGRLNADPQHLAHNAYRHGRTHATRQQSKPSIKQTESITVDDLPIETTASPYQHCEQKHLVEYLMVVAESESPNMRHILQHWYEDISIADSAETLNMTPDAVKKARQRFKAKANNVLQNKEDMYGY
ncbi:hypothetical protein [Photobacterium leiognathi]|uniref:hypothetical protein n=1 Tax=Photobacterium leiognathi TaxID=553611 RepID=UPI0029822BFA|nr:hypothetical protein [Photobacterium leiognathi]